MIQQTSDELPLDEDQIRVLEFHLALTVTQRFEVPFARLRERALKRSLCRQVANKPTSAELSGPDHPDDYAIWIANGRRFSIEDARRRAAGTD